MSKSKQLVLSFEWTSQSESRTPTKTIPSTLKDIVNTSELKILGLSSKDVAVLDTIVELGERYRSELVPSSQLLTNPTVVHQFAEERMRDIQKLGYLLILVDTKHKLSHTYFYETVPLVRLVLRRAVARTAAAFFIVRNELKEPSFTSQDESLIQQLSDDSHTIGIDLLDFLVIGEGKYTSARMQGIF